MLFRNAVVKQIFYFEEAVNTDSTIAHSTITQKEKVNLVYKIFKKIYLEFGEPLKKIN